MIKKVKYFFCNNRGQTIVEIMVATAIFVLLAAVILSFVAESFSTTRYGKDYLVASGLMNECMDAVKSIRDRSWSHLDNGPHGLTNIAGYWDFGSHSDTIGRFTRIATIESVERDETSGDIVSSGGRVDPRTKKIICAISWEFLPGQNREVSSVTYLTDWNVFDWHQTSYDHFSPGTFNNTTISGSGIDASIVLAQSSGDEFSFWVPGGGNDWTETTDTEFGAGTLSDVIITGVGEPAYLELDKEYQWRNLSSPTFSTLNGVAIVSVDDAWAVGVQGRVTHWDGISWSSFISPTNATLNDIAMVSSTDGWIVGSSGEILRYDGTSWSSYLSPTSEELLDISMISSTDGWAVGSHGAIIRWNGTNWSIVTSPTSETLNGVDMISSTDGWAVGSHGAIIRWNGISWSIVASPTTRDLNSVSMVSATDGWAVGSLGAIIRWNGTSWSIFTSPSIQTLNSVLMISASNGYIVGNGGVTLQWNGASWLEIDTPTSQTLNDVYFLPSGEGYAVGIAGTIIRHGNYYVTSGTFISQVFDSGKSGTSWDYLWWTEEQPALTDITVAVRTGNTGTPGGGWSEWSSEMENPWGNEIVVTSARYIQYRVTFSSDDPQASAFLEDITINYDNPTKVDLFGIHLVTPEEGWAVGDGGVIVYYNGINWNIFASPTTRDLYDVSMTTSTEGFAVGASGTIIEWNGTSWNAVASPTSRGLNGVHLLDANDGWAVGDQGTILQWDGISWEKVTAPSTRDYEDVFMVATDDVWAVGASGEIAHYDGISWSSLLSPVTQRLHGVSFIDANNGQAVGAGGNIIAWNGANWSSIISPVSGVLYDIDIHLGTIGWAVGANGEIIQWTGSEWVDVSALPSENDLNALYVVSTSDGWAVGNKGTILRLRTRGVGYYEAGTFLSQIFNSDLTTTDWMMAFWDETLPSEDQDISIATRGGNTATPDLAWSDWSTEMTNPNGSLITTISTQYLQYRLSLTTSDTSSTPELHDITITYKQ